MSVSLPGIDVGESSGLVIDRNRQFQGEVAGLFPDGSMIDAAGNPLPVNAKQIKTFDFLPSIEGLFCDPHLPAHFQHRRVGPDRQQGFEHGRIPVIPGRHRKSLVILEKHHAKTY